MIFLLLSISMLNGRNMRKNIVAGNHKMNLNYQEATALVNELKEAKAGGSDTEVFVIPPFPYITGIASQLEGTGIGLGAQNCSLHKSGAYTGEVAADMLKSAGADMVLVGHSERREYFKESNAQLAEKINRALEAGLIPVYCIGESLEERKEERFKAVIETQLVQALFHLPEADMRKVVIAYEPVWAIGTGETASPEQAQEVHAFIRKILADQYGEEPANEISILYGGSVKPGNAKELFAMKDIDGGLIGGASLNAPDFLAICNAF